MSTDSSANGPNQGRTISWSDFSAAQRGGLITAIALLVLFCGVLLAAITDDPDPDSPAEFATEIETTASPSPSEEDSATLSEPTEAASTSSPEPEPEPETTEAEEEEVYYENCDAARDAGAAPVHEGEPGYRDGLDRDGDGVGCEESSSSGSDSGGGGGSDDDGGGSDVHYDNCTEVREAGAAPIYEGDPGYGSHLDRDGDGVACET